MSTYNVTIAQSIITVIQVKAADYIEAEDAAYALHNEPKLKLTRNQRLGDFAAQNCKKRGRCAGQRNRLIMSFITYASLA